MKPNNKWSKKSWFRRKNNRPFRITLLLTILGGLALFSAALVVPLGSGVVSDMSTRGVKDGPDSYFNHIYDPDHLLGSLGHVDLDLDNIQRSTGNIIIFAAFPKLPSDDPFFTLRTAEQWAPGLIGDDRAIIVFLFMDKRLIRAEVGYGYEENLTDITMAHIIQFTMVPLLREGKLTEAIEACSAELQKYLTQSPQNRLLRSIRSELPVHFREIKRKVRLVARIWFEVPQLLPRLILSAVMLILWFGLVSILVNLILVLFRLGIFMQKAMFRHDVKGGRLLITNLLHSLTQIIQAALVIFVVGAGGGYFLRGSGLFGGGGVNVFW